MNQYIRQAQYKKGFANIIIIVLVVLLAGVVGYFTFQKRRVSTISPPLSTPSESITVVGNSFSASIDGYFETCMDSAVMYKRTDDSWEKVSNELPGKGRYYLDDKFVGYGMCDVVVCTELPKPFAMQLIEYRKVGEKAPPPDSGSVASAVPAYQTIPLSGDIKIDIQYFSDNNCQNKKTFSTVIKR